MIRPAYLSKYRFDRICIADLMRFGCVCFIFAYFLRFSAFSSPTWRGVHKCGTPSLAKSFSPVLCWQSRRERVRPRRSDAWQSGSRRGTRFAFVRCFCLCFCSYHYSAIGAALPLQCFREEISLQDQQIFGDRLIVGHVRDAGQRQERVLASGSHQRLAQT